MKSKPKSSNGIESGATLILSDAL